MAPPHIRLDQKIALVLLSVLFLVLPFSPAHPATALPLATHQTVALQLIAAAPIPTQVATPATSATSSAQTAAALAEQLTASSAAVLDVASGSLIFAKNIEEPVYPASTTKLLTALVARETYDLQEVLAVPENLQKEGNAIGLFPGEKLTVSNLLRGLLVQSGNDAAEVLAASYPGGRAAFVERMNQKAVELGLRQTHFTNPAGLDEPGHQSSTWDLTQLLKHAMQDQVLLRILGTEEDSIFDAFDLNQYLLYNTNALLHTDSRIQAGKTGTTPLAGQVLVTLADINGHKVIIAVAQSQDRYHDTSLLLDWLSAYIQWKDWREFIPATIE